MSDTTPNLALPYIMSAQAQKHVTHNEALRALDALTQISVASRSLSTPPVDPEDGSRYIVADSATDDWLNQSTNLAAYQDGAWAFYAPTTGWQAWVEDESTLLIFTEGMWSSPQPASQYGAFTRLLTIEENLDLSGSITIAAEQIPNRAIVLGVSIRVATAIEGATSFDVGIAGETDKFGGSLGINVGDTNIGVIGPSAFYADTPVQLTANGTDFTGGSVRLVLHLIECGPALN